MLQQHVAKVISDNFIKFPSIMYTYMRSKSHLNKDNVIIILEQKLKRQQQQHRLLNTKHQRKKGVTLLTTTLTPHPRLPSSPEYCLTLTMLTSI